MPARPDHPSSDSDTGLLALRPAAVWKAIWREPLHFWALGFYYFIEYVRPQGIYPALDSLPLGRLALLLTIGAWLLAGAPLRRVHVGDYLLGGFAVVLYLSGLLAVYPEVSAEWFYVFVNWTLLYFLTTVIVTTPRRFFLFLALFLLWSFKLSQFGARTFVMRGFSFTTWGIMGPQGWFQNSSELAIQMCVFFPMAVMFVWSLREKIPPWGLWIGLLVLPGTAALTTIASSSRGGQLGLVAAVLVLVFHTRHRVRGLLAGALVLAGLWFVLPDEQIERFQTAGDDDTSVTRLAYWDDGWDIARSHPVLGIGYRNWLPYYRAEYNPRGELPHNILVEAAAELGFAGLALFLGLVISTIVLNRRTRRIARSLGGWSEFLTQSSVALDAALAGYLVAAMFVTVLYYPFFWVNFAFVAALYHVARREEWRVRHEATSKLSVGGRPADGHMHRRANGMIRQ